MSGSCYMYKNNGCNGGIKLWPHCEGHNCPFAKTAGQQRKQEEEVVKHFKNDFIMLTDDYISRVDKNVLIRKDEHNLYCVQRMAFSRK